MILLMKSQQSLQLQLIKDISQNGQSLQYWSCSLKILLFYIGINASLHQYLSHTTAIYKIEKDIAVEDLSLNAKIAWTSTTLPHLIQAQTTS